MPQRSTATLQRCAGILQNELYVGRLVWNKVRMVKDPDTREAPVTTKLRRVTGGSLKCQVSRLLVQIYSTAAQKRKQERTHTHPSHQRRPRRMLSGLLRCGSCGSGMATNGRDKSGRVRIRCSAATESGTCPDAKTFLSRHSRKCCPQRAKGRVARPEGHFGVRPHVSRGAEAPCSYITRKTAAP